MKLCRIFPIALALSVGMAGSVPAQNITVGLLLPEEMPGFDFVNGMYGLFKDEVEANSEMSVDLVYGGALGAPNDRLAQMRRGVIQMTDAADGNYASIFSDIQVLNMPYLFPNEEVAWKVLDGPFGDKMADDIREVTGVRVLGWWESGGFKHFSANKPLSTPEDLDGLKLRVLGPLATTPVEAMGASASRVSFGELYTSLRTGVVDGQDNSVSVFNLVKLYEVQDHLTLTGHSYAFGPLGISDAFYAGLTAEQQQVIDAAAEKAIAFNRETSRSVEAEALDFTREQGVEVVDLTPDQRAAFKAVMQPVANEWLRGSIDHPELVDEALAAVEAAR
ncbi:TRAP transporter substrate-binding protein [Paracoccus saliphilus]|uniref:TRAP transporter substrate-binding protein n=1 Tax=Paracoccus saliphilus TaxID=405559 RepID=A0AA45W2E5_9RHOB|nr:TRAP transporter substrate-binding protein [Paracoccus saliphilus]WCR01984.1 TRAP transporter substrate-binding protein [Paracoccus saliphilus]SIS66082.1 tripartite ATP-independent transporter solute receptor, DctP family [Paracoccus saliphilus]